MAKSNARTFDGVVHEIRGTVIDCMTAWETSSDDDKLYGKLPVFMTDDPVSCLECLAKAPQPREN